MNNEFQRSAIASGDISGIYPLHTQDCVSSDSRPDSIKIFTLLYKRGKYYGIPLISTVRRTGPLKKLFQHFRIYFFYSPKMIFLNIWKRKSNPRQKTAKISSSSYPRCPSASRNGIGKFKPCQQAVLRKSFKKQVRMSRIVTELFQEIFRYHP